MPSRPFRDPIQRLWGLGSVSGLREGALLDRFLRFEDESAFEAILSQHGPMVLAVCRRFLRDPHDVEDAFQATFLVLVRKASGLRDREALGPWLYGVAYRVAVRARSRARAAGAELVDPADTRSDSPNSAIERAEAAEALHEELARLAGPYRDPIVLCHLEGLTHDQAAERLNWPVGTVRGRLWRGREQLRERLARRGFGADPQTLLDANRPVRGREAVPGSLIPTTLLSASRLAAGGSLRLVATPTVAILSKGVLGIMLWNTLKIPIVLAVLFGFMGIGAAATTAQRHRRGREQPPARKPQAPEEKRQPAQHPPEGLNPPMDRFDLPPVGVHQSEIPPDPDDRNLPMDYFPAVNDDDAPAKIRAARLAYDAQLDRLTRDSGVAQGELQILEVKGDALKRTLEENLRKPGDKAQASVESAEREIRQNAIQQAEARRRVEEVEGQLKSLKDRPRPTDRLVVQPGDFIRVEVLEALPGRPITGERWIRPDGKISLDFYGDLYVAGLTTDEIKEKVILKLRKFIPDQTLGLVQFNAETEKTDVIQPRDSDRVFVELMAPNEFLSAVQRANRNRP